LIDESIRAVSANNLPDIPLQQLVVERHSFRQLQIVAELGFGDAGISLEGNLVDDISYTLFDKKIDLHFALVSREDDHETDAGIKIPLALVIKTRVGDVIGVLAGVNRTGTDEPEPRACLDLGFQSVVRIRMITQKTDLTRADLGAFLD